MGVGGQSEVHQSLISLAISLAFNRVKPPQRKKKRDEGQGEREEEEKEDEGNEEKKIYRALVIQVTILRLPEIHNHPNIIHLIGVCWDVRARAQENDHPIDVTEEPLLRVWSVLVVERMKHGDLNCFMKSNCRNLDSARRLKLCIDIGSGIRDLRKSRK